MTKQLSFFAVFLGVQLFLIFFQIHKNSTLVKYSYQKQKNEKIRSELIEKKNSLTHALQYIKARTSIKADAQAKGMIPLRLEKIKRIDELHDNAIQSTP